MGLKDWIERPAAHVATRDRSVSNLLRGAAARLTTPLLPDDYLHLANPLWSARELRGRIVEVRRETADSATLVIKPGWGFDFGYAPGQYIGIGLHVDGRWHWRSYSLTSSPTWDRKLISITVKAMTDGFLSSHLVSGVPSGTIVRLAAPKGEFVLSDPRRRRSSSSPRAAASPRSCRCCAPRPPVAAGACRAARRRTCTRRPPPPR